MKEAAITFSHVHFAYEPHLPAVVNDVSFSLAPGSFTVIVGPSGGGKSTLLRLITGLDHAQSGTVTNHLRTRMIFQGGALLPWLTVFQNVLIGLTGSEHTDAQKVKIVREALGELGISELTDSFPRHLSGGQRQRVGIARALVSRPECLLLDEPFSALDIETTERLSEEVLRVWKEQNMTMLMVSHSMEDAVLLVDQILVFKDSHIAHTIPVSLPRPRHRDDPEVRALVKHIQGLIPRNG